MTLPARFWSIYARKVYEHEQRKGRVIFDQRAFEDAVALDGMRRLYELADRWWASFVVTPHRLAEALIDNEAPRYCERRE